MTNEFKKITEGDTTRFVLESASVGSTSDAAVNTGIASPMGAVRRRPGADLINQEGKKDRKDPIRVKSPVAKAHQSIGTGSGEHKNPKHTIPRKEKHKKPAEMHEAGYGSNRGYHQGFASPTAPSLGQRYRDQDSGDDEPQGIFTVMINGKPWKEATSNEAFAMAQRVANKYPDKKVAVKWPTGQLNSIPPQGSSYAKQLQSKLESALEETFNGEYDDEAGMAHTDLHTIARAAQGLLDTIDDKENLPEWAQEKIAKVEGMLVAVWDYLKSQEEQGIDPKMDQGVAEGLNEFAPDGFNGGDDGEEFNPRMAKMAYDEGVVKGASLADGATLERAMAINDWDKHDGGIYKQHFAKGFKAGRMDKIRHNNKQYNLNLKLMKDGSIRHGEQGVAEGVMSDIHLEIGELLDPYIEKYKNGLLDADHLMHLISKSAELLGKKHNSDPAEFQKMISDYVEQEAGNEEGLDEVFNPSSALANFLRGVASVASDLMPAAIAGAGTFAASSALIGPVAAAMAGSTVGQQVFQAMQSQQNRVPGMIQKIIEKYFGSEAEEVEFSILHAKAVLEGNAEFRWRGEDWKVTLEPKDAEAIVEKNDKYWLDAWRQKKADAEKQSQEPVSANDEYSSSLEKKLAEKLSPQADVGDWVDDFKQADPQKYHQFRNKNDAKKQQMAVAAYMAAKDPNKHKR